MAINVKFLKGTAAAYAAIAAKDVNTFYYTDDNNLYLGEIKLSNAAELATAVADIATNAADIDQLQADLAALIGSDSGSIADMIDAAIDSLRTELSADITANADAIAAINNETTGILAQAKAYTDTEVGEAADAAKLVLEVSATTTEGYAKTYVLTQGTTEVGKIDLPKELVVTAGEVVVDPEGQPAGTYIQLTIANQDAPIYINVKDLVDVYTAAAGATQVQVAISDTNEVSATLVAGGVGTAELADSAVEAAKIADGAVGTAKIADTAVTRAKISADFEQQIAALETAIGEGGGVAQQITAAIEGLDASVDATGSELIAVKLEEVDGKVTAVTVTEDLASAFDAAGSASAVETKLNDALTWGAF